MVESLQTLLLALQWQHLHWYEMTQSKTRLFKFPKPRTGTRFPNMINRAVINVTQINSLCSAVSATYLSNAVWQFFPDDSQLAPSILMSNHRLADWGRFSPPASSSFWNLLAIINQGHLSISTHTEPVHKTTRIQHYQQSGSNAERRNPCWEAVLYTRILVDFYLCLTFKSFLIFLWEFHHLQQGFSVRNQCWFSLVINLITEMLY